MYIVRLHHILLPKKLLRSTNNCVAQRLERCLDLKTADTAPRVTQVADLD